MPPKTATAAKRQPPKLDAGAGLNLASQPGKQSIEKGDYSVASRAIALSSYFLSGVLAINLSQWIGSPLYLVNQDWYNSWMAFSKQSFALLTMTLTQAFAPTKVIITGDESVRGQMLKQDNGNLLLNFPERMVLMANHQIYTDWLYLWWLAYCNGMHGRIYIMLKESLKKIPIIGWGMQFSQFIFVKRNWEKDKPNLAQAMARLNNPKDPMWLLLFPEGTVLAESTRVKSAAWAKKTGIPDMRHMLLPRSTGLQFCMNELKETVDYLYDVTVAYHGVGRGQYALDIYTLREAYMEGRPPKSVHMHFRRFAVKDIPLNDEKAFGNWLTARWREKDELCETYLRTGSFPADTGASRYPSTGKVIRGCGQLEVGIQSNQWYEFLQIFAPMGALVMVLFAFYGALPKQFMKMMKDPSLAAPTEDIQKLQKQVQSEFKGKNLDAIFDSEKQEESFQKGAMAVQDWLNSEQGKRLFSSGELVSKWLDNPEKMLMEAISGPPSTSFQDSLDAEAKRRRNAKFEQGLQEVADKGTFWQDLQAAERQRQIPSAPSTNLGGNFHDKLKAAEESRRTSIAPGNAKSAQGNFYNRLKAAEARGHTSFKVPANLATAKGTFWDKMKKEENSRHGTVVTLSSDASSGDFVDTASVNGTSTTSTTGSGRKPPKLGTSKPTSKPSINKMPVSKAPAAKPKQPTSSIKQSGLASAPTPSSNQAANPIKKTPTPTTPSTQTPKSFKQAGTSVKKAPTQTSATNPSKLASR